MKKKNQQTRKNNLAKVFGEKVDFCWIFLPNGDMVHLHDERDYSELLNDSYESKSNQPL
jgi:hypothetical protein